MLAYRLVKAKHALEAFNGEGARRYGGRWNEVGIPMVYAAQSRALAAMETLVHLDGAGRRLAYVMYEIELPDSVLESVAHNGLPPDWRSLTPPASVQALGSAWQRSQRSAALLVPSVLVEEECCVLLNPVHPDTAQILIRYSTSFEFDGRL